MSFVKKAVKKVFSAVKKVVKKVVKSKWFKIAAIAALTFFTAGVAAVGFSAFAGVSTVGGFFGAVGSTLASGWSAVVGGLKTFGTGIKSALGFGAQATPATSSAVGSVGSGMTSMSVTGGAEAAVGAGTEGILSAGAQQSFLASQALPIKGVAGLAETTSVIANQAVAATSQKAAQGFLGRIGSTLFGNTWQGSALRTGISTGVNWWLNNESQEREWERQDNATVWLGPAFGGSSEAPKLLAPSMDSRGTEASVAEQESTQGVVGDQRNAASLVVPRTAAPERSAVPNPQNYNQSAEARLLAQQRPARTEQPPAATQPPQGRSTANLRPELLGVS